MSDNEVKVTIRTEDIPPKDLKKIQKLKSEFAKKVWKVGSVDEEKRTAEYYEREVLEQDIHIIYTGYHDIVIFCGHDIDRDNLKQMEKIIGVRAEIDVAEEGKLKLSFDLSKIRRKPSIYDTFPIMKNKDDIRPTWNGWDIEIKGWTWRDRDYST